MNQKTKKAIFKNALNQLNRMVLDRATQEAFDDSDVKQFVDKKVTEIRDDLKQYIITNYKN